MRNFQHFDATSVQQAVSLLSQYSGKAAVIAGGTDLITAMKEKVLPTSPQVLVNIKTIPGLSAISEQGGTLSIGALATLSDIATNTTINSKYPLLAQAAQSVGAPTLRNMATIAGNIRQATRCWYYRAKDNAFYCIRKGGTVCYAVAGDNRYHGIYGAAGCYQAHPSDMAPALMAMGASVSVTGSSGDRTVLVEQMYTALADSIKPDEIITAITMPTPAADAKGVYLKFRTTGRNAIEFPLISVAASLTVQSGKVTDAKIALGGAGTSPLRATAAESAIVGSSITTETAAAAGAAAVKDAVPLSMNKYKVNIARALVARAILAAAA
jgi:xanthine dehydrogenase YagS FAD-binding subunit